MVTLPMPLDLNAILDPKRYSPDRVREMPTPALERAAANIDCSLRSLRTTWSHKVPAAERDLATIRAELERRAARLEPGQMDLFDAP
jgi:hypothetical protein